ncbi:MAG: winged helix-turn-helix domain-containing protein [Gemmataceae bacterium]
MRRSASATPLWTRRPVRALVRKEFGLGLAVRTVGLYLQRWGYTPQRPARRARKQNPDEVKQWLEAAYPGIAARARREGARVLWCDEVGVAADHHPGYGYARRGRGATVDVPRPDTREGPVHDVRGDARRGRVPPVPGQADPAREG